LAIRDEKTGEYRKDVKLLHIKFLDAGQLTKEIVDEIQTTFKNALAAKGLDQEYIIVISGPELQISLEQTEDFIQTLTNESESLKRAEVMDRLIDGLKKAREKRWRKEEEAKTAEVRSF